MVSWQVIFLPHLLVVVAWLVLCHLQIGPGEHESSPGPKSPEPALHLFNEDSQKVA